MLLMVILASITGVYATRDIHTDVPEHAMSGENVELVCQSDVKIESLHWFKEEEEFFTFIPRPFAPIILTSPLPGFQKVETMYCNVRACKIRLNNLSEEGTGMYRCDIERSRPHPYKIATKIDLMNVSAHPNPVVLGLAAEYLEGAVMQASCESKTKELRWFINEREIESLRGSQHFLYVSNRHMFSGMPPEIVVKCVEDFNGRTYESEERSVLWSGYVNDVEVPKNGGVLDFYSILIVSVNLMLVNLVLTFCF